MKGREEEKIDKERKIRKFGRYVDDSLGIWKEEKNRIGRKVDEMEEKGKGIELKLEEENEEKITFLDIKLQKKNQRKLRNINRMAQKKKRVRRYPVR